MKLSWLSIVRIGLVQMSIGAIVVLMISTLNRLMVVELALPAILPGFLVALHYGIQITRPQWGFRSDAGGNRTFWIIGGMFVLAVSGLAASFGTVLMETQFALGLTISIIAFACIGLGVGASGTSLLAFLATATAPDRRAAAAAITWLMMIAGFAITTGVVGALLDPYSPALLLKIIGAVCALAFAITCLAIHGLERSVEATPEDREPTPFREALAEVWAERNARNFTIFVFLSMVAYFMQELILEPYAGLVFAFTPGESTSLSSVQNQGVFFGMLTVAIASSGLKIGSLRGWVTGGCIASALALFAIAAIGQVGVGAPLGLCVLAMGFANGVFAVAAIGSMMELAGSGREKREGTRMGLWGAAQAMAGGCGAFLGTLGVDAMRLVVQGDANAYGIVFIAEGILFLIAAVVAMRVINAKIVRPRPLTQGELSCATM